MRVYRLVAALLVCFSGVVLAEQAGNFTYVVSNNEATITAFKSNYTGNLVIPDTLGGYSVTAIGTKAFYRIQSLTGVTIPNSVLSVGDYAFHWCLGLKSLNLGLGVTNIGASAFFECYALTNTIIPQSVMSIGSTAFGGCFKLTEMVIPDSVSNLGESIFLLCKSLKNLSIGQGVSSIGPAPCAGCYSLTNIAVDPANHYYTSSNGVLFDKAMTTIIDFPGGRSGTYAIPHGVHTIAAGAFWGNSNLTTVIIPRTVTAIKENAFRAYEGLQTVIFMGFAPTTVEPDVLSLTPSTIYYFDDTIGWEAHFAARPTVVLQRPTFTAVWAEPTSVSVSVVGATNFPIAIEATTNWLTGSWERLCVTNLKSSGLIYPDWDASNRPVRFYRLAFE